MRDPKLPLPLTGFAGGIPTNQLSGSSARRPGPSSLGEANGSGTLRGAGEEGQEEENHRDSKKFPQHGGVRLVIRRVRNALLSRKRGGGTRKLSPSSEGSKEEEGHP